MTSAARCAAVKSTYCPVSPPTKASWSICANHCGRRAASPSRSSNGASRAARSSSVSLTSNAITLAMVNPPGEGVGDLAGQPVLERLPRGQQPVPDDAGTRRRRWYPGPGRRSPRAPARPRMTARPSRRRCRNQGRNPARLVSPGRGPACPAGTGLSAGQCPPAAGGLFPAGSVPAGQMRPAGRRLIRVRPEIGDPHDAAVLVEVEEAQPELAGVPHRRTRSCSPRRGPG